MRRFRSCAAVVAAALLLPSTASAAPAAAAGHVPDAAAVARALAPVRGDVATVRALASRGDVAGVVTALRRTAGESGAAPGRPAVRHAAEAIAGLVAAVAAADDAFAAAQPPAADVARARGVAVRPRATLLAHRRSPAAALAHAARIAAALDAAVPLLAAGWAAPPAAPLVATGAVCDLVDQPPSLCVAGSGAQRHTDDYLVVVDLGGDDTYTTAAGGVSMGARLVLDLAGDDRYEPASSVASPVHGGALAGVGMLVDLAGADTYRVTSTVFPTFGQGWATLGGVGLLVDGGGDDTYAIRVDVAGDPADAVGQAFGALGGAGALVDRGGDDRYTVAATALRHPTVHRGEDGVEEVVYSGAQAAGQGAAVVGGAALFADGGGTDALVLSARLAPAPAEGPRAVTHGTEWTVTTSGQGSSVIAGTAYLLTGTGNTTYDAAAVAGPLPTAAVQPGAALFAQGAASVGGVAVLSDLGGDDGYTVTAQALAGVDAALAGCDACVAEATAGSAGVQAQGHGLDASVGLVDDGAGDDRYTAVVRSEADLVVRDGGPEATASGGVATAGDVLGSAQAVGLGPGALGAIRDAGGDDTYTADAASTAAAVGHGDAGSTPEVSAWAGGATLEAQAAGVGADGGNLVVGPGLAALVDLGGADRYAASATRAETIDGAGATAPGLLRAQGSMNPRSGAAAAAAAIDLDGGAADTYVTAPVVPTCAGIRGGAAWADCGPAAGGVNA